MLLSGGSSGDTPSDHCTSPPAAQAASSSVCQMSHVSSGARFPAAEPQSGSAADSTSGGHKSKYCSLNSPVHECGVVSAELSSPLCIILYTGLAAGQRRAGYLQRYSATSRMRRRPCLTVWPGSSPASHAASGPASALADAAHSCPARCKGTTAHTQAGLF